MMLKCKENDTLNMVWYNDPDVSKMNRVIFDKGHEYYGCKSLGREPEFEVYSNKLWCRGEQVLAYHQARGAYFPKLNWDINPFGFRQEVIEWFKTLNYGISTTIL
jgi:hypothetical protein